MSNTNFTPEENGLPSPDPTPPDDQGQPRGNAQFPVPHPGTFAGISNYANRSYSYMYDEAQSHSRENAERMRLDPVIGACLRLRAYPTALLTSHIDPEDDEDEGQLDIAMQVQKRLIQTPIPGFTFLKRWLLEDGTFKGRSGAQLRYQRRYDPRRGKNWHLPTMSRMIDGDKLVFGWNDARVGILVGSTMMPSTAQLGTSERGRVYYATPEERQQLVIHEFEPEDASFYRPNMAGAIHGTGMRGKLYWLWALKDRVWAMGMDFLQWFARGLTVYYFKSGNIAHYNAIKAWVEAQNGASSLFYPWLDEGTTGFKPLERFEASTASPQFLQQLITNYFDDLFKLNILGQTLTSGTASTGLGSGVAQAHQSTFENFVKYDALALGETFTRDILKPFYDFNFPGVPCGRWVFEVDDPNVQQMLENAEALYQMGAAIPEEPLMDSAGIPLPKAGQTILTNIQGMQPAAVGQMPEGVPATQPQGATQLSRRQREALLSAAQHGDRRAMSILLARRHPR